MVDVADVRKMTRGLGLALSLAAIAGGLGCKPKRTRVPAICDFDVASDEEIQAQSLPPMTWLTLASPTIDSSTMTRTGELVSACGQSHESLAGRFECPGFDVAVPRVRDDRVEATDLIIDPLGEGKVLLWAATDELVDGQAEGAAAMALWADGGLEIHAVGVLRGYRQGARMRLHKIGTTPVLVLESDRCDRRGACDRIAQVVPIVERRLLELPVWQEHGCTGRAQFELVRKTERKLEGTWVRRFVLTRSIELVDGGIVLNDLVVAEDRDMARPDIPARPYMRVVAERPLTVDGERLVLAGEDLWSGVLRDDGRVRDER